MHAVLNTTDATLDGLVSVFSETDEDEDLRVARIP